MNHTQLRAADEHSRDDIPNHVVRLAVVLLFSVSTVVSADTQQGQPSRPPNRVHLMLEEELVAEMQGLRRVGHSATKAQPRPVLSADRPSDGAGIELGSVRHVDGRFLMWYWSIHPTQKLYTTLNSYATSDDGIHWRKPKLGLFAFGGSKDNNLIVTDRPKYIECPTVVMDNDADPNRRFKLFGTTPGYNLSAFCSADGIHWSPQSGNPIERRIYQSDQIYVEWDPWRRRYICFCKFDIRAKDIPKSVYRECSSEYGRVQRFMWCENQKTLTGWQTTGKGPKGMGETFGRNDPDWPMHQFYGCVPVWYEGNCLGMLLVYHSVKDDDGGDSEWVYSRDGHAWRRTTERTRIVCRGEAGAWDSVWAAAKAFVPVGDEIWIYYNGSRRRHGYAGPMVRPKSFWDRWIGLAKLRRDGFVSIQPIDEEGTLQTVPVPCAGKQLLVNADARDGQLRVEIQDEQGHPVPGFTLQECQPIRGDSVRHRVAWHGGADLTAFRGKTLRLRIQLRNASLYAFRFTD